MAASITRACTIPGCGKKFRARDPQGELGDLCVSHYNARLHPDRRHPKLTLNCAHCATPVVKQPARTKGFKNRFCSYACRDAYRAELARLGRLPVLTTPTWTPIPARHPARQILPPPRVWVAGECAWCGESFVSRWVGSRFCSTHHAAAADALRERHRRGFTALDLTDRRRFELYERDGWVCWLCNESVARDLPRNDDWAPSLDHVLPRSKGGSNHPSNLRLAHRWCNAVRGDETYYTAEDLRAA